MARRVPDWSGLRRQSDVNKGWDPVHSRSLISRRFLWPPRKVPACISPLVHLVHCIGPLIRLVGWPLHFIPWPCLSHFLASILCSVCSVSGHRFVVHFVAASTAPRFTPMKANCSWTACWTWAPDASWLRLVRTPRRQPGVFGVGDGNCHSRRPRCRCRCDHAH